MKYFNFKTMQRIILIVFITTFFLNNVNAQDTINRSGILGHKEHSIGITTGMDYSILPFSITYKRGMKTFNLKYPVNYGAEITIPLFAMDLNDLRFKIISEATILRKNNFEIRGGINPMLITTKMETETMTSLGSDFHLFLGFTNTKWNVGLHSNFNQVFSTYIKHTDKYRDNVFNEAVDGWYKLTASNFRTGIYANRTIKKLNIYIDGGISKTGTFKNYLFVPNYYFLIGANYKL
jgi:hypothetical protein